MIALRSAGKAIPGYLDANAKQNKCNQSKDAMSWSKAWQK
jgi:hypothetical protein